MAEETDFLDAAGMSDCEGLQDSIAQRAEAYRRLLSDVSLLPRNAADLKAEGILMLRAVRMSFKSAPQGEIGVVRVLNGSEARS